MKILFWQNVISKHQKDLLEQLSELNNEIKVVVESDMSNNRKDIGWGDITYNNIEVFNVDKILNDENIEEFLRSFDFHIFSSISSYKYLYKGFKLCQDLELKIIIYSENKDIRGIKGKIRYIQSKLDFWRHNENICKILAIGEKGEKFFSSIGFPDEKIVNFGYYIKPNTVNGNIENLKPKYLFVGNLSEHKGLRELVNVFNNSEQLPLIDVYGDGPLKPLIQNEISRVNYKGIINNDNLLSIISSYDYLILPSKYDGWGVVINEALLHGCNVITTDAVGSSSIIKYFPYSYIIQSNNIEKDLISLLPDLRALKNYQRTETIQIAHEILHPKVGAKKLLLTLERLLNHE